MPRSIKKIFLSVPLLLMLCGCVSAEKKVDLLASAGMEEQSDLFPGGAFQPFSKVITPHPAGWLVKNPLTSSALLTVFNGITLEPDGIYELRMRYVGFEKTRLILNGAECRDGKILKRHLLLNTVSFLNVNGSTEYRKEFAVTPDCEQLIPSLLILHSGKSGNATELLVEELAVYRVGTMKSASDELKNFNIAEDYDFSQYPEGDFDRIHKGSGPNAKKWSDVKAEIVKLDGEKVLHIVRTPENYIYPFMELKPFPVNPQYYFIKYTFQAKGNGSIKPGLWWKRFALSWDYYHGEEVKLTDQWQTITVLHPCMSPDVSHAGISFTSQGSGEFWIKDISVNIQ